MSRSVRGALNFLLPIAAPCLIVDPSLNHNRGQNNGAHGVFVIGGDNLTDGLNYGSGNTLKPDCSIDGQSTTPDGRYC